MLNDTLHPTSPFRDTRKRLRKLHAKHPTLTRRALAARLGVSIKRISKLAAEEGLTLVDARGKQMGGAA